MTMEVQLLRIDSRLLHGQVATNWAKALNIDRILVVSDRVAQDVMRKVLITQAAPPGIKANVITVEKMIRIYQDLRFFSLKPMVLVEDPIDAKRLVEGGIKVETINIGAVSFDNSRVMVTDTVAVSPEDVKALKWLHERGIRLDVRKVSSDNPKNLWKSLVEKGLVKKA
ncbi:PTS system, mannose-specific IIB component [Liquorilactobacillus sucicola DSM 21376 = JCM 15457]|uniref:PTS system, IIB component n=1 Tax=Liquorilactobacillus sucicola DSM 21376 = JCM 15457 TaxID=1423806 RepID=A0A023D0D5_9LACO|nr:PTS sugar transporter subunit IIB [Liquorilactobacillus sucicola]KRN06553.1 PTS system, IIB component [Liquorilactobacillus sucicola DSM 21376 = JCM 15457]GAJ27200.1 PTS system, mannose-specific IIB component [Liquorilactobacillus sucicola DSM 21376 = JCM 15457]